MFASTSAKKNDYLPLPLIVDSPTTVSLYFTIMLVSFCDFLIVIYLGTFLPAEYYSFRFSVDSA